MPVFRLLSRPNGILDQLNDMEKEQNHLFSFPTALIKTGTPYSWLEVKKKFTEKSCHETLTLPLVWSIRHGVLRIIKAEVVRVCVSTIEYSGTE